MKISPDNCLLCPECGGEYLHCQSVEAFDRLDENSSKDIGTHVTVSGFSSVAIDRDLSRNPSGRRDGSVLTFNCETCDAISEMRISQHKGNTFIEFIVSRHNTRVI